MNPITITQYRTKSGTLLLSLYPNGDIDIAVYTVPAAEAHELAAAVAHATAKSAALLAERSHQSPSPVETSAQA